MATTYTSTIEVRCIKEHTCICCGAVYSYEMYRKIKGSASSAAKAAINAKALAAKAMAKDVDQEPCPTCGLYQPDMVGQQRAVRHKRVFWLAMIAFAVIVILRIAYAVQTDTAVWLAVGACAIAVVAHLAIDLANPNRSPESNLQTAAGRVTSGRLRYTPGKVDPGAQLALWPGRSMAHRLALVVLAASLVLVAEPEALRATRSWPLNAECYPPVVGPGDQTRIYMDGKITSVKGYWRGRPDVTVKEPGPTAHKLPVEARTNQNDWGSTISVKSSEKNNSSTPWVAVSLPADSSLAGKAVDCNINLQVTYPEMEGSTNYATQSSKMTRSLTLQLAPVVGAGGSYDGWWWSGTVLGMGLILFCGLCLLRAARGLQRRANPTRVLVPGNPPPV
jgi:hypothetical protein